LVQKRQPVAHLAMYYDNGDDLSMPYNEIGDIE